MADVTLPGMSLADTYNAVRATVGEAANQPPDVQQKVFSTIVNRANATGKSVSEIASDTGVYQGYDQGPARHLDPNSDTYKAVLGNLTPVAQSGPTTDATHFYAPGGMPRDAHGQPQRPAWDNGTGKQAGAFVFLNRSDTLPAAAAPPDSAFAGGSTSPTQGPAAQQTAEADAAPPDTAFAGGSTTPGGPPAQQAQAAPPADLPPPNMLGYDPALTAPQTPGETLLRSTGATLRGFANAASFGLADKLDAATGAIPALVHGGLDAASKQYTSNMNAEQAQNQADAQQVPFAHWPAAIAGALAQAGIAPQIPVASILGRMGIGAGQASLFAGLNAVGQSRGSLGQAGKSAIAPMLTAPLVGAPLGAVAGAAPQVAGAGGASLADHAVAGVDPMLAISGPRAAQQLGQTLKGIPIAGAPLAKAAARTSGQLSDAVTGLAGKLGTAATPYEAGGAAVEGAQGAVSRMQATEDALYKPLNELEASDTKVGALNTQSAINGLFAKYPNIPDWLAKQAPTLVSVQNALKSAGGRLTYGELKSVRSDVGKMIKDHTLGSVDQARLKTLYGAMSDDMQAGIATTAKAEAYKRGATPEQATQIGQAAKGMLTRANAYSRALHLRVESTLEKVVNAKSNEQAFAAIQAAARSGRSGDLRQLTMLRRSLAPEDWNNVSAGVLNTMARDANGHFSVDKFDTELNKLTPEAKRLMFGEDAPALEAIGRIARQQKAAGRFYNHSNSGHANIVFGMLLEPITEAAEHVMTGNLHGLASVGGKVAGGLGVGYGAARLLASPGFARLALSASKVKTMQSAELMDGALAKYATQNASVAELVGRYRQIYMQNARANLPAVSAGNLAVHRSATPMQMPQPAGAMQ